MTIANKTVIPQIFIVILAFCFLAMLGSSLVQRFLHPSLTVHLMEGNSGQTRQEEMPSGNMELIGRLMREVAASPQDKKKAISLVEALMQAGQWQVAENFAQKALAIPGPEAENTRTMHLLAIIHHNKGEHAQAAELLEKTLEKGDNPSARYSLGILYLHFLNRREKGLEELRKGLTLPDLPESLRAAMQEELDKAEMGSPAEKGQ